MYGVRTSTGVSRIRRRQPSCTLSTKSATANANKKQFWGFHDTKSVTSSYKKWSMALSPDLIPCAAIRSHRDTDIRDYSPACHRVDNVGKATSPENDLWFDASQPGSIPVGVASLLHLVHKRILLKGFFVSCPRPPGYEDAQMERREFSNICQLLRVAHVQQSQCA